MFGYIDTVEKKTQIKHRNYYLTQGDSFTLTATPKDGDINLISKIVFKIGTQNDDTTLNEIYSQDYYLRDGVYYLNVESETTRDWRITEIVGEPYVYEIEVHYVDGGINTVEQSEFTIKSQIRRL